MESGSILVHYKRTQIGRKMRSPLTTLKTSFDALPVVDYQKLLDPLRLAAFVLALVDLVKLVRRAHAVRSARRLGCRRLPGLGFGPFGASLRGTLALHRYHRRRLALNDALLVATVLNPQAAGNQSRKL